jgi:hypothetical protein
MDITAMGQTFIQVLWSPPLIPFNCGSPYPCIIWGMNNKLAGCSNSETLSHPMNMNNKPQSLVTRSVSYLYTKISTGKRIVAT